MADTVNLSVSDPISADIQAICKAVEAAMNFFATPEGQATCKQWRESAAAFNLAIEQSASWLKNLFEGK